MKNFALSKTVEKWKLGEWDFAMEERYLMVC